MKRQAIRHTTDGLLAFLLFGVFAACLLIVLLTGAGAYRRLTVRDSRAADRRSCAQYLATRVRQGDCLGGVSVGEFDGVPALILTEDGGCTTRVYCYEGYLMELYSVDGGEFGPEDGTRLMEANGMELSLRDNLLTAAVTGPDGERDVILLSLRGGEGIP